MITPILIFVFLCVFLAAPAFAIPSPDFLGPAVTWILAMLGFAGAFMSAIAFSLRKFFMRRWTLPLIFVVSASAITIITVIGISYYRASTKNFTDEVEHRLKHIDQVTVPAITTTTTATTTIPARAIATSTAAIPSDLISSRVFADTILVPMHALNEAVRETNWADRVLLLDIREAEEREIGLIPATSTWMRYGDLIHGGVESLPKDRDILVICWNSMRGKEIATWLRKKEYPRSFAIFGGLQGDATSKNIGWINSHLPWRGEDRWSKVFENNVYDSRGTTMNRLRKGAVVLDTRDQAAFDRGHLEGARWFPMQNMSSADVSSTMEAIAATSSRALVVACARFVDCFYARIIGVRLERLGWDYSRPYKMEE